ncbi:MAG: hypothetical protein GW917_01755, partial [Bdellovibrionales bacterium]|nr:hypothetical protein [Bdellovibrionales bacterium]
PLLKSLLNKGLNLNGEPVDFDLVRVNPEFLETLRARIDKAVALTLCRHADRSCEEDKKSIANHTLLAFPKKMGRSMLSLFLAENPTRPVVKETPVRLRNEEPTNKYTYDISVSEPSQFGTLLRVLWGPHAKFKVDLSGFDLDKRFGPNRLKAYPTRPKKIKDQVLQSLKKNIAFNRMMVGFISHHLQRSEKNFEGVSMSQLYDMLRVQTEDSNNKYTFVLTSKDVTITKIDIQNSKVDWVLTKHLIASNYSDDVIFAGEFYKAADGSIHIDDNSGTYQPPKGLVYKVADLFREIFPGVTIVVHGHE